MSIDTILKTKNNIQNVTDNGVGGKRTILDTNSKNKEIEEQTKLADFMKIDQNMATTGTQTLGGIAIPKNNLIQAVLKSKDEELEFHSIPPFFVNKPIDVLTDCINMLRTIPPI
jgi:hypothetical protein